MQMASSASCTCMELASTSEYTATVRMFSSLHARMIRTAISPRFATRIFSNMCQRCCVRIDQRQPETVNARERKSSGPNFEQRLAKLDWFRIFDQYLCYHAFGFGLDLVHDFHRLNDANDGLWINLSADFNIRSGFRRGRAVKCAYHW